MADELTDETMRDARNAWSRAIAKGSGEYGALSDALEAIAPSIFLSGQIAGEKAGLERLAATFATLHGGGNARRLLEIAKAEAEARIAALEAQK